MVEWDYFISIGDLQDVKFLLEEWDGFIVDVPELKLLRQYYKDAVSWVSNFNRVLVTTNEREDQHNVVDELKCILADGLSLKIQGYSGFCLPDLSYFRPSYPYICCYLVNTLHTIVWFYFAVDALPLVETELQKALCREKAQKAWI